MNAEMEILKNQWRSTRGMCPSEHGSTLSFFKKHSLTVIEG